MQSGKVIVPLTLKIRAPHHTRNCQCTTCRACWGVFVQEDRQLVHTCGVFLFSVPSSIESVDVRFKVSRFHSWRATPSINLPLNCGGDVRPSLTPPRREKRCSTERCVTHCSDRIPPNFRLQRTPSLIFMNRLVVSEARVLSWRVCLSLCFGVFEGLCLTPKLFGAGDICTPGRSTPRC